MNSLLKTPELVGVIMNVVNRFPKESSKKTLSACAAVNRLFSREAIRLLWKELENLIPLWHLIPEDAIMMSTKFRRPNIDYTRPLVEADWNRVLYYASFVRILRGTEWTHLYMTIINPEVEFLERFGNTFPDSFLFPGLLQLEGLKLKNKAAAVLLSPSLLHIRVEIPADTSSDCAFLLFQKIQDMEHIEELSLGSQVQLPPDLLPPLRSQGMPSLVELMLPKSTTYHQLAIVHSAAPHIQRLFIHANSISTSEKGTLRFSHLKQLDLHGSIPGCIHVLHDLEVHPAEVLSIERTGEPEGEWRQLFAAIGEMPSSDLWYIDVRISEETPQSAAFQISMSGHQNHLQGSVIDPLLKFKGLQVLKLRLGCQILFIDSDVKKIVQNLPDIRHLHVMGHTTRVGDIMPTLTPACLKYLAFEAPNLRSVSVYITSEWNLLKEVLGEAESSSKLRKLDVGLSPISFPPTAGYTRSDVSALLLSCFPELEELVNEYYREWTLIRRALVSGVLVIGLESDDELDW